MAIDATILAVGVKAEGVKEVTGDLGKLATQAGQTEQAARRLGDGFNSQLSTLAKTEQANNALIESWAKEVAMLGKTKSEMMGLEAAHNKFNAAQMENVRVLQGQIKAYEDAQQAAKKYAEDQEAAARSVQSLVSAAKVAVTALTALYGISIKNGMEAEQSSLRLEAILKATGGAAGVTKEQIDLLADSMAQLTQFDDEALRNAAGTLLSFGSVGVSSFERTLRAGADLAAFMGTDLNNAMRMLGKALEDPSVGMTALRRTGIMLTDSQIDLAKAAVDAGNKLEAQRIILEAVEGKVGGVAEKMNSGLRKATSDTAKAFDELTESISKSQLVGGSFVIVMEAITGGMKAMKTAIDNLKPSDWAQLAVPDFGMLTPGGAASYATGRGSGPSARGKISGLQGDDDAAASERATNAQNMLTEARKKAGDALGKLMAQYSDEKQKMAEAESAIRTYGATLGYTSAQIEQMIGLARKAILGKQEEAAAQREANLLSRNYADTMKRLNDEATKSLALTKPIREEEERLAALYDKSAEQAEKRVMAMEKETEKEQQRAAQIGLTKEQVNLLKAAWDEEAIARAEATLAAAQGVGEDEAEIDRLKRKVEALKNLRNARLNAANAEASVAAAKEEVRLAREVEREWQRTFENVSQFAGDFLVDFAQNGKSAFQNLWDSFKNMALRALAELATKQIMVSITGAVGLTGAGGAAANAGGGMLSNAGGSMLGSLGGNMLGGTLGTIGSAFTGGSLLGAGGFGAGATAALDSALITGFGGSLSGLAGGTLTAVLGPMMAAAPYLLAAYALYSMLKPSRGGPKSGGFGSMGDISGITGADNGRWFTPNNADPQLNSAMKGISTAYNEMLKGLGGTGSAGFAMGYDTDPQGTAPNRLHAGAFVGGRSVYDAALGDLGRDDAALEAAMTVETKRMLLAALKASELPTQIAAVFNTITAETASSEQIDNVLAFGSSMKQLMDILDTDVVTTAQEAWDRSQQSSAQTLRDMGREVTRLANGMDGSLQSMQDLTAATGAYKSAVAQVLVDIHRLSAEMTAMFAGTRQTLELIGLSNEEQIAYLGTEIEKQQKIVQTSDDPYKVAEAVGKVNQLVNQQLGLMTPEQLAAQKNPLLAWWNEWEQYSQGRLKDTGADIVGDSVDPFTAASTTIDKAATLFDAAATTNSTAADNNLLASQNNLLASENNLRASERALEINITGPYLAEVAGG